MLVVGAGLAEAASTQAGAKPLGGALTLLVTSNGDLPDIAPGDGTCADAFGACSLRAAIQEANAVAGLDVIRFHVGFGPMSIAPDTELPEITDPALIDGSSQPGYAATPIVELDGSHAGTAFDIDGLTVASTSMSQSFVRNLVINRFGGSAVRVKSGARATIGGNFLGTDPTGMLDRGNHLAGVLVDEGAAHTQIGGVPLESNLISGNTWGLRFDGGSTTVTGNLIGTDVTGAAALPNHEKGLEISGGTHTIGGTTSTARNVISGNEGPGIAVALDAVATIRGNLIGTDSSGTTPVPNQGFGVEVLSDGNTVGGTGPGARNVVAFNGDAGIWVGVGSQDAVRGNNVYSNEGLGIDLGPIGVTPNDTDDPDTGPNGLQNFPVLTSVTGTSTTVTVAGTLDSAPSTTYDLDVYASRTCDGTANGEGEAFVGTASVTTDGGGDISFSATLPARVPAGRLLTATVTDPGGNTSEFSACRSLGFSHAFVVTSGGDQPDATPGDGFCAVPATGLCTLRAAIEQSNASPGEDVIVFGTGTTILPATALPTVSSVVSIIGPTSRIRIDGVGAGAGVDGLRLTGGFSTVRNLILTRFQGDGIELSGGGSNAIENCMIGTTGTVDLGNGANGINVRSAGNMIGGTVSGTGNLISGNTAHGLSLSAAASSTKVFGNLIGPTSAGGTAVANGGDGIFISTSSNQVGGSGPILSNTISGNGSHGIEMASGDNNTVRGNRIGTSVSGTAPLGNTGTGMFLGPEGSVVLATIGGRFPGEGNILSGNGTFGVEVASSARGTTLLGNRIGTSIAGNSAIPNALGGVVVEGAELTLIGEGISGRSRNLISGNGGPGIEVFGESPSTKVRGNIIGLAASGGLLGNAGAGIAVVDGTGTTIGSNQLLEPNVIAGNGGDGIEVTGTDVSGVTIRGNRIRQNGGLAVDLGGDGVTANDGGDPDNGPNGLQNFPTVSSLTQGPGSLTIAVKLSSAPDTSYTIEAFAVTACDSSGNGEADEPLGVFDLALGATGKGGGSIVIRPALPDGFRVAVTATDSKGNASELSPCAQFLAPRSDLQATTVGAPPTTVPAGEDVSFKVRVKNLGPGTANSVALEAVIPAGSVLATVASTQGTCTPIDQTRLGCSLGSLASGSTLTVTIPYSPAVAGPASQTATVTTDAVDPVASNDGTGGTYTVAGPSCTILGTQEPDPNLAGGSGDDVICGLRGADVMSGAGGQDVLVGASGGDTLNGGTQNDLLLGGAGSDILRGQANNDTLDSRDGVAGNDALDGGPGTNTCFTDAGDSTVNCS